VFLLVLIGLLIGVGIIVADTLTGEIHGGVLDTETKLTLPAVAVTLTNADQQWRRPAMTDAQRNYVFLQLDPGRYALTFEKDGYYPKTETDIQVRLNQPKVVLPPVELRRQVSTPTREVTVATPEGSRTAIFDLTSSLSTPTVLTYINERGYTS